MSGFVFRTPDTLEELTACLREADRETYVLGGGTDLMIKLKKNKTDSGTIIDMTGIKALEQIRREEDYLVIGANVTYSMLQQSEVIRKEVLCLSKAAKTIGAKQIQNMARLPGNLANASKAGDAIPVLMALDAAVKILDGNGETRLIKVQDFIVNMGKTQLKPNEAIIEIVLPRLPHTARTGFGKIGHGGRNELTIANASLAMVVDYDSEENIINKAVVVVGSVAPKAFHAIEAEAYLQGKAPTPEVRAQLTELLKKQVRAELGNRSSSIHKVHDICGLAQDVFDQVFWDV